MLLTIDTILRESDVLKEMHDLKELKIIGGMYDIKNGAVDFFE